jgi:hypothetical protein
MQSASTTDHLLPLTFGFKQARNMAVKRTELCTCNSPHVLTLVGQYVLLVRGINCKMSLMHVSFLPNKDAKGWHALIAQNERPLEDRTLATQLPGCHSLCLQTTHRPHIIRLLARAANCIFPLDGRLILQQGGKFHSHFQAALGRTVSR